MCIIILATLLKSSVYKYFSLLLNVWVTTKHVKALPVGHNNAVVKAECILIRAVEQLIFLIALILISHN